MILWELLTRKRPYEGYKGAAAVAKIGPTIVPVWSYEGQRPAWPAGEATPVAWRELTAQCWDEIPTKRPPFKTIAEQLRAVYPESKEWPHPDTAKKAAMAAEKASAEAAAADRLRAMTSPDRSDAQPNAEVAAGANVEVAGAVPQ